MFTWICPQCGREVPPSYAECPTCAENAQRAAQGLPPLGAEPVAPVAPPPPPQQQQPMQPMQPMSEWQPQQPLGGAPPVYVLPGTVPSNKRLPTWLMVPGFAVLIIAVLFGVYRMVGGKTDFTPASTKSESAPAATVTNSSNPYAKFIEVAGVRVSEDAKQKARVQMVVVNHSNADLPELELKVTLRTVNAKDGEEPLAVVKTKIAKIEANGLKEVSEPLATKLRAYELPDWQFLRAEVDVVSPK